MTPNVSFGALALVGTLTSAALTAIANLLIRTGLLNFGGFSPKTAGDVFRQFASLLIQPPFFVGLVLYFAAALVWFRTLPTVPLSVAYPVLVGVTFIFVTAGAFLLWDEPFTVRKAAGLLVILGGIVLVSGVRLLE